MAEKIRATTPAGSAGIMRFYDVEGKGIKIEPSSAVLITIVFIVGVLLLKLIIG